MSKILRFAVGSAAAVALLVGQPTFAKDRSSMSKERKYHHKDKDDAAAAAVIAGVVALGIGVAIAKHGNKHNSNYQWDQEQYGQPFSPNARVTCYPRQRICYKDNHTSYKWTRKVFGDY